MERLVKRKQRKKEKRENNTRRLKKELDRVFSIWIRKRDSNKDGKIICPCCFKMLDWQEAQNMHYNSRAKMNTRYDEQNCYAGCYACNICKNGNYPAFTDYLLSRFGEMWLRNLIAKGNIVKQWNALELKELIKKYGSQ